MKELITICKESEAIQHFKETDPLLYKAISLIGPIEYVPHSDEYAFLIREIISQMLAKSVANKLYERLSVLCNNKVTLEAVDNLSDEQIKSIGTSYPKIRYIRCLNAVIKNDPCFLKKLNQLEDEQIIKELTKIKGIGVWTAKMYLIFSLDRQNVIPYEDKAFLQGYAWLYNTKDLTAKAVISKCKKWEPYASIAARYMYKLVDNGFTKENLNFVEYD